MNDRRVLSRLSIAPTNLSRESDALFVSLFSCFSLMRVTPKRP